MSLINSDPWLMGGYGFGIGATGFGISSYVLDGGAPKPEVVSAPAAQAPIRRPYTAPYGFAMGGMPGYGPFPGRVDNITAWAMRRYPMSCKVHARVIMPVLAGNRSIRIVDDGGNEDEGLEVKAAAENDLLPMLKKAMPGALESPHFGHWLQEVVWQNNADGRLAPVDVQSILPQEGVIHVDEYRHLTGCQMASSSSGFLKPEYLFLSVHRPHIDPILGESNNVAGLNSWYRATKSAENADALERKASGIQLLMYIMQGMEIIDPLTNLPMSETDKCAFLTRYMNAAVSGQSVLLPDTFFSKEDIARDADLAKLPAIRVDKFDWGNQGPMMEAHLSRKRELDVDICSAWGVPERAVMEADKGGIGQNDAGEAGDVVLFISENFHSTTCEQWDKQVSSRWMKANFPNSKVKFVTDPDPLSDPQQKYRQEIVADLIAAKDPETMATIGRRKLLEGTELPVLSEKDAAAALQSAKDAQQAQQDAKNDAMAKGPMNGNGNGDRFKKMAGK